MSKKSILLMVSAALAAVMCMGIAACSSNEPAAPEQPAATEEQPATSEETPDMTQYSATDEYVSDEVCLGCHGGSYDAVAALTESYGPQNPHNSIHGGPNSCDNCHDRGSEVTDNMCDNCHVWPREDASIGLIAA